MSALLERPASWRRVPLWSMFTRVKDVGHPEEQMLSVYRDLGVVPKDGRSDNFNKTALNRDIYQLIDAGWLAVNRMKAWQGSLGISEHRGIVSGHYICFRPTHGEDSRFLHYLLRSPDYAAEMRRISRGVRPSQIEIDNDLLRVLPVWLPPLDEQRRIADFLDAETARIDALIAAKQQMHRQATARLRASISLAVACGPTVKTRRVITLRTSGPRGWADRVADNGCPFVRSQNLQPDRTSLGLTTVARVPSDGSPEAERSRTRSGDVVIGITGANTGWVGVIDDRTDNGYVSQHVAILRPGPTVETRWLAYSFFSDLGRSQLLGGQYGGTKQQLSLNELADLEICCPPLADQKAICDRIDAEQARTDALSSTLSRQIELLRERRQALITAAVSGELDL